MTDMKELKRNGKRRWQFVTNLGERTRRYSAWLRTLNYYISERQIPVNSLRVSHGEEQVKEPGKHKCLGQVLVSDLHAAREPATHLAPSLGQQKA